MELTIDANELRMLKAKERVADAYLAVEENLNTNDLSDAQRLLMVEACFSLYQEQLRQKEAVQPTLVKRPAVLRGRDQEYQLMLARVRRKM